MGSILTLRMFSKASQAFTLWCFILSLAACATSAPTRIPYPTQRLEEYKNSISLLAMLDEAVGEAGVRDASSSRVPGFAYLRANRFLAALKDRLKDPQERDQWVDLMFKLSLKAREKEIRNLPTTSLTTLSRAWRVSTSSELYQAVESASNLLLAQDRNQPKFFDTLKERVHIPDEYSTLMRVIGIYPLTSLPVNIVSEKSRRTVERWYKLHLEDLPVAGELTFLTPPEGASPFSEEIKTILRASAANPLGVPLLKGDDERRLASFFAPVFIQDVFAPYDRPGKVTLSPKGISVDTGRPVVYYYTSYAILHDRPIIQFNYVIWYGERAGKRAPWMERGKIDGLTARISLDADGEPFMIDAMNNCGCYHFFVPKKERVVQVEFGVCPLGPFVPQWMPDVSAEERLTFRINSGWHQIERVLVSEVPTNTIEYDLTPYEDLESLPDGREHYRSAFNKDGIIEASKRIEPLILFSMGIHSIGSMRQRGHHAIELTCREHFDDPYLFEKSFLMK